jgi:hypothetical protein
MIQPLYYAGWILKAVRLYLLAQDERFPADRVKRQIINHRSTRRTLHAL